VVNLTFPLFVGANIYGKQYNETWRMARKIVHNSLNINASRTYLPYQDLENKRMLLDFLETPVNFREHIRRYTNSLITQIVFGFRTPTKDDPKLKQLVEVLLQFSGSELRFLTLVEGV
jgi:hypothetical protein